MPLSAHTRLLIALALLAQAPLPAHAAEFAGKWYGKLDSEPTITIAKTGADYHASLDNPDSTKLLRRREEHIHKEVARFEVSGNSLHFTIRSTIDWYGDTNYARDEYDLTLSDDGSQLTGKVRHIANNTGNDGTGHSVPQTLTPITLYSIDWSSRTAAAAKN